MSEHASKKLLLNILKCLPKRNDVRPGYHSTSGPAAALSCESAQPGRLSISSACVLLVPLCEQKVSSQHGVLEAAIKAGFQLTEEDVLGEGCACICGPPRGLPPDIIHSSPDSPRAKRRVAAR